MLHLLDAHARLFKSWQVDRYEQEDDSYMLQLSAILQDDSHLSIRDYLFADGRRKYAYHWMESDGALRRRWDNAPHWPDVVTAPHHEHLPGHDMPQTSTVTSVEDLLLFLRDWFEKRNTST